MTPSLVYCPHKKLVKFCDDSCQVWICPDCDLPIKARFDREEIGNIRGIVKTVGAD